MRLSEFLNEAAPVAPAQPAAAALGLPAAVRTADAPARRSPDEIGVEVEVALLEGRDDAG